MVIYNEIEPYAADYLENLSAAGLITCGRVERRSIADLTAADVADAIQFHTFAGIGVWSHALRLAGWPDDRSVWTGSCPCQPFSQAGKRKGIDDARHLWPEWFRLIRQRRPAVILGEQVASPDGLKWLDAVSTDLEREGYAFGAADLCAAGVGAPHIRQRLYFVGVADTGRIRVRGEGLAEAGAASGGVRGKARNKRIRPGPGPGRASVVDRLADDDDDGRHGAPVLRGRIPGIARDGAAGGMGDAHHAGPQGWRLSAERAGELFARSPGLERPTSGFWSAADWLPCRDGKWRPVEPGTFPLADGPANRVGRLRAYGNAIVSEVAATWIRAVMESIDP